MNSFVFYEGKSQLDGKPIVGIATLNSANRKTGNVAQTWIMRSDINPIEAMMTGKDSSVCGDCKLRKSICYVALHQAPFGLWRKYSRGELPKYTNAWFFSNRIVRLGSYGECLAIPRKRIDKILAVCSAHLGYSHQWKNPKFQDWKGLLMASVDNEEEARLAQEMGWRTFRVKPHDSPRLSNEIVCPASRKDLVKEYTCASCLLCDGIGGKKTKNIVEDVHGIQAKIGKFNRLSLQTV